MGWDTRHCAVTTALDFVWNISVGVVVLDVIDCGFTGGINYKHDCGFTYIASNDVDGGSLCDIDTTAKEVEI